MDAKANCQGNRIKPEVSQRKKIAPLPKIRLDTGCFRQVGGSEYTETEAKLGLG